MRRLVLILVVASALLGTPCLAQINPGDSDPDLDGIPGLAPPPANPQPDVPSVLTTTGRLLIDRSHNEAFNVSGFTSFLLSQGWVITEHAVGGGPITEGVLAGSDVLMIPTRSISTTMTPFSVAEVAAIQMFLYQGRGLWVLHDNLDPTAVNTLSQTFGVTFKYDYIQDPTNFEGGHIFWPRIHILDSHPVTAGIRSYVYYLGDCLAVSAPALVVARADEDAYSLHCPAGSQPPTLAVWQETGRAVFAGDVTTLATYPGLPPGEQLLLQNIVNWLMGASPTATSPTTWGRVKSLYTSSGD